MKAASSSYRVDPGLTSVWVLLTNVFRFLLIHPTILTLCSFHLSFREKAEAYWLHSYVFNGSLYLYITSVCIEEQSVGVCYCQLVLFDGTSVFLSQY